jgi:Domain of unknown function (DUF4265)
VSNQASEELVKIHVEVSDDTFGIAGESVWAKPLGDDLYEIRNNLWHSCEINWGDVVKAVAKGGNLKPEFIKVVRKSGHRTLHIYFYRECKDEDKQQILSELKRWKAAYENSDGQLYAVDVEPAGDFDSLCDYLDEHEAESKFSYRTVVTPIASDPEENGN